MIVGPKGDEFFTLGPGFSSRNCFADPMRITALALALALLPVPVFGAPNCRKGRPCGNTCIAASKTCHTGGGFATHPGDLEPIEVALEPAPMPPFDVEGMRTGEDVGDGEEHIPPVFESDESPPKICRREDFTDFDAFVACRIEQQGSPPVTVGAPVIDPVEEARQREAAEARAELGRRATERAAAEAEQERRTQRTLLALLISGGVLDAAGIGLLAAASATGESVSGQSDDGPICTIGKRCGDTCIAAELTCQTPTGGGSSSRGNPRLLWPGVASLALGSGLLAAALVIYRRNNRRTLPFIVTTRGVGFRF